MLMAMLQVARATRWYITSLLDVSARRTHLWPSNRLLGSEDMPRHSVRWHGILSLLRLGLRSAA